MKKHLTAMALGLAVFTASVQAQTWPTRPIKMVVPYAVGGAADLTARVLGQKMAEGLGVPVVIENKPGANGGIGTDQVAKAAPDGYTLLLDASGPIVVNPVLYAKVPYDPVKDLLPISQVTSYQYVLVVPAASPITSLDNLLAIAKAKPGTLTYGSAGIGSGGHLAGEMLAIDASTKMIHAPYKGNAPALADLLGGQLSFSFDTVITSAPHIAAGKLRPFAVSGPRRAAPLPGVPTMQELGFKDFEVTQFQGLFAPAGTNKAIVARLHAEVVKALKSPDVVKRLADEGGNEIVGGTPEEFAKQIRSDLDRYGKLIKTARITAE
jgi:tripartite-type tricarboxylate transporter receptor subunit TctC